MNLTRDNSFWNWYLHGLAINIKQSPQTKQNKSAPPPNAIPCTVSGIEIIIPSKAIKASVVSISPTSSHMPILWLAGNAQHLSGNFAKSYEPAASLQARATLKAEIWIDRSIHCFSHMITFQLLLIPRNN